MPRSSSMKNRRKNKKNRSAFDILYIGLATTTGKGRNAVRAFFNVRNAAKRSIYSDYTVVIPVGDRNHETAFFIRQEPFSTLEKLYRIRVYDSNVGTNLIGISQVFASTFKRRDIMMFTNGLHGIENWDFRCAHYSWLEIFLNFDYCDNPFHRELRCRPIRSTTGQGHHGPTFHNPWAQFIPIKRNRNQPNHQMSDDE